MLETLQYLCTTGMPPLCQIKITIHSVFVRCDSWCGVQESACPLAKGSRGGGYLYHFCPGHNEFKRMRGWSLHGTQIHTISLSLQHLSKPWLSFKAAAVQSFFVCVCVCFWTIYWWAVTLPPILCSFVFTGPEVQQPEDYGRWQMQVTPIATCVILWFIWRVIAMWWDY